MNRKTHAMALTTELLLLVLAVIAIVSTVYYVMANHIESDVTSQKNVIVIMQTSVQSVTGGVDVNVWVQNTGNQPVSLNKLEITIAYGQNTYSASTYILYSINPGEVREISAFFPISSWQYTQPGDPIYVGVQYIGDGGNYNVVGVATKITSPG